MWEWYAHVTNGKNANKCVSQNGNAPSIVFYFLSQWFLLSVEYADVLQDQVQLKMQSLPIKLPYSQMLVHP